MGESMKKKTLIFLSVIIGILILLAIWGARNKPAPMASNQTAINAQVNEEAYPTIPHPTIWSVPMMPIEGGTATPLVTNSATPILA